MSSSQVFEHWTIRSAGIGARQPDRQEGQIAVLEMEPRHWKQHDDEHEDDEQDDDEYVDDEHNADDEMMLTLTHRMELES